MLQRERRQSREVARHFPNDVLSRVLWQMLAHFCEKTRCSNEYEPAAVAVSRFGRHAFGELAGELLDGMLFVTTACLQSGASSARAASPLPATHDHTARRIRAEVSVMSRRERVRQRLEGSRGRARFREFEYGGMSCISDEDHEPRHGRDSRAVPGAHCAIQTAPIMTDKLFISADSLLADSFELANKVLASGYRPSFLVALWRGGAPIGIAVQELLEHRGLRTDHITVRTSSYTGIDQQEKTVRVHAMDYLVSHVTRDDRLLIVDDVFDSGRSLVAVLDELRRRCPLNHPREVRIATVYYKPSRNQSALQPDYYVHSTEQWLVFPHELVGLSDSEIAAHKPTSANRR